MFRKEEIVREKEILAKFSGKTVLICGAGGLIGSTLAELLLCANDCLGLNINVIASGRNTEKLSARFKKYEGRKDLAFYKADVAEEGAFDALTGPVDFIVDCASPAHPVAYANTPVNVLTTNFLGTLNLLKTASKLGSRMTYVSSSEVYGEPVSSDAPRTERDYGYIDVLAKRSCYPEGKRAAENLCIAYGSQYGCDVLITRFCQIFGASVTDDNTRADAQFLRKCLAGEDIVMKSPGSQIRSMCYAKDAAFAILYILANGSSGEAYNVASKDGVSSIRNLAECMARAANVKIIDDFDPKTADVGFITRAVIDGSKLMALGWTPRYSVSEGVDDMFLVAK